MTTTLPTDPCKTFKEWKIFILGQNAIYEGRNLTNSDVEKPFTTNEELLSRVLNIKWMETNYPPELWEKGRWEKFKKKQNENQIKKEQWVNSFYENRKFPPGIIG